MSPVVHFELPYENALRAATFYHSAFGWQTQELRGEMGTYVVVTTATSDVRADQPRGAINGGLYERKPDWPAQYPAIVISVDAIEQSMLAVRTAGGEVLGAPVEIPGVGLYVSFLDTEGNRSSMLQPTRGVK